MHEREDPRTAAEWLIALREAAAGDGMERRFESWLEADESHRRDWTEMADTYDRLGLLSPAEGSRDRPTHRAVPAPVAAVAMRPGRHTGPRRPCHRLAAIAVALAACLVLALPPGVLTGILRDDGGLQTGIAEVRQLTLGDGSRITLGPRTAIAIDLGGTARQVTLRQGMAYFEVAPDPGRPFRVRTDDLDAVVLGTAFEMRTGPGSTALAVAEGRVRAETPVGGRAIGPDLGAGDWLRRDADGRTDRGRHPSEQVAAWRHGLLIARDLAVAQAVDRLRPFHGGRILLLGSRLARQPLTGLYTLSDPAAALEAMAAAQGAVVHRLTPWLLVLSEEPSLSMAGLPDFF
ncbi:FecR family protein [Marinibaculum pumilum]|uniref:FecR family protein n=1 Tax=Marinibaculum pumilum TaxID=1766165 RepID=A0ABV7L7I8_9PROT